MGLGLNYVLKWNTQWFIFYKLSLKWLVDESILGAIENKEVSSVKNVRFEVKLFDTSFM